jgi:uncharacterized repeat protein (TIGR03803 family)
MTMLRTAFLVFTGYAAAQTSLPTLRTIYSFTGVDRGDGSFPLAGLADGKNGVLYGTTNQGGLGNPGEGTIFELKPPAAKGGGWTETVLYRSPGAPSPARPQAGVVIGRGALYGNAQGGDAGAGAVFQIRPPTATGGSWTEIPLYSFPQRGDGNYPQGSLVADPDGVLYGITSSGYSDGFFGTVFALTPPTSAGGSWTKTTIYNLGGGDAGQFPMAGLAMGKDRFLYGTTSAGGSGVACGGCGTVFKMVPPAAPGGAWTLTTLYSFQGFNDGAQPWTAPTLDPAGAIYGTTQYGGPANAGTVFKLTPPASPAGAWTEEVLYSFEGTGGAVSSYPNSVVFGSDGALYGTAQLDGLTAPNCATRGGCGTVFKLAPPVSPGGVWTETVLYSFTGGDDGAFPSSLVLGPHGALFGTTSNGGTSTACFAGCGTVFAFTP